MLKPATHSPAVGSPGFKGDKGDPGTSIVGPPGPPGQFVLDNWINSTRPLNPGKDIFGYNREEKRIEFYIAFENKWYYSWQGGVGVVPPPTPPALFSDNFDSGWFDSNLFTPVLVEGFDSGWFDSNPFILVLTDDFSSGWFTDNVFTQVFSENFEGVW